MAEASAGAVEAVRLLLAGGKDADLTTLGKLLTSAGQGRLQLQLVEPIAKGSSSTGNGYDLLLYDGPPGDAALHPILRKYGDVPSVFLREPADEQKVHSAIRAVVCRGSCPRPLDQPCMALVLLSVIEKYRENRNRRRSNDLLQKLSGAVEQSPDVVVICNSSGVIEYVNPAFERISGYTQNEVLGQGLGVLKSEQQSGELYEAMWATVLSGNAFHGLVLNRKKNGETFILEKSMTPMRDPTGQITHFIVTGRDITDQKRLESQLHQVQKMDAIGKLAGGVAHDFNNLLMVITANAELILDRLAAEDPSRQRVDEILGASRRAADLTRQLLTFGRQQVQSLRVLDLNSVVSDIGRMLPRLIGEDIQFVFLPGCDPGMVQADPVQIEQVVMNLATNARDAMPHGGKLTIETGSVYLDETHDRNHSTVPPGEYVVLTVSDSGEGIAPEHVPHIFEPFYTTKGANRGTGLGLATVYGIVEQSGGFIWLYSAPGIGTTFKIYLPRLRRKKEIRPARLMEESPQRGSETVLLVEDDAAVRRSTREFLTESGYTVVEAENGEAALRVSREYGGPIELMITDVVMPKLNGPSLAQQISAERPAMKVLFVSGYPETTVLQQGEVDVSNFLSKPFGLKSLASKVRDVVGRRDSYAHGAAPSA